MDERKSKRLFRFAVDEFVRVLSQIQKRRVNYRCNNGDSKAWGDWIKEFENRGYIIGEDFIKTFTLFGVQSWMNPDSNVNNKYNYSVRINWIFGKNGIRRWDANPIGENKRFIREGIKSDFKLLSKAKTRLGDIVTLIRPSEESHKQRFYNTKRGIAWCIVNTYLYHHRSPLCVGCDFRDECKDILKENYPKIYKIRGYDK